MTPTIQLTTQELMQAGLVGVMRRVASIKAKLNKNVHAKKSNWATDIDGAAAEMAFAKYKDTYWSGHVNSWKAADVGVYHVRSTNYSNGHLIIRPNDPDGVIFVLVIADAPYFRIVGTIPSDKAKLHAYRRDGTDGESDAWWIPQHHLTPIDQPLVPQLAANDTDGLL